MSRLIGKIKLKLMTRVTVTNLITDKVYVRILGDIVKDIVITVIVLSKIGLI